MIERTYDVAEVDSALRPYPELMDGFVTEDWLKDPKNIAISDDLGNVGLLVYNRPHIYCGHYFFKSRGREAIIRVKEMIDFAFTEFPIKIIVGVTPIDRKGALYMNRRMGFVTDGVTETVNGPCELVTLTREDFYEKVL